MRRDSCIADRRRIFTAEAQEVGDRVIARAAGRLAGGQQFACLLLLAQGGDCDAQHRRRFANLHESLFHNIRLQQIPAENSKQLHTPSK